MPALADFADVYAISSWMYVTRSLEESLPKMARAGFKWVELWGDQVHMDPRINPDVKAIKELIKKLGLRVHSVHAPFSGLDIGLPDTSLKARWLEVVGASLDVCAELEAGVAVLHASSHRTDLGTTAAYKGQC
jgi:sugar phosphate isomerase/epimerase